MLTTPQWCSCGLHACLQAKQDKKQKKQQALLQELQDSIASEVRAMHVVVGRPAKLRFKYTKRDSSPPVCVDQQQFSTYKRGLLCRVDKAGTHDQQQSLR